MRLNTKLTSLALLSALGASAVSPAAFAQSTPQANTQKNKNDWRNLGAAAAAVAGYGLLKGDNTATLLGAAGAAYSAKRYEDERKAQDQNKRTHQRARYYRGDAATDSGRHYYRYNGDLYYLDRATGERVLVNP